MFEFNLRHSANEFASDSVVVFSLFLAFFFSFVCIANKTARVLFGILEFEVDRPNEQLVGWRIFERCSHESALICGSFGSFTVDWIWLGGRLDLGTIFGGIIFGLIGRFFTEFSSAAETVAGTRGISQTIFSGRNLLLKKLFHRRLKACAHLISSRPVTFRSSPHLINETLTVFKEYKEAEIS